MMYHNIEGLRSKSINIFTQTGVTKFNLQNNNELGLPSNAVVVAIQCRNPDSTDGRVSNGRDMVDTTVFENSYLNLKYRDESGKIDLLTENYYMPYLVDDALFLNPIESKFIDWNESFIQINQRAVPSLSNDQSFEIVVHYLVDCPTVGLQNRFEFRTSFGRLGVQHKRVEFELDANQRIYTLSNTENIGLPLDAYVIGFNTSQPAFPLRNGIEQGNCKKSCFLTIKKGTTNFIDAFPTEITDYKETLFPEIDYFPIEPIRVNQVDWNQSFIQIFNPALIAAGEIFSIDVVWYKP